MESPYIIKKEFLNPSRYEDLRTQGHQYEALFSEWLNRIISLYEGPTNPKILLNTVIGSRVIGKEGFAEKLQAEIYPFVHSMHQISSQHISYVKDVIRQSASVSMEKDTDKLLKAVAKMNINLSGFQNGYKDMVACENVLKFSPTSNPEHFLWANWIKRLNEFERYEKIVQHLQQNKPDAQNLIKDSIEVENEVMHLRKRIISNKFKYLKQSVKIARKLLACQSEYLSIGCQMLAKINAKIKMDVSNETRGSMIASDDFQRAMDVHQQFVNKAQSYRETLTHILSLFKNLPSEDNSKLMLEKFYEYYAGNEPLLAEMFDVLKLFETFAARRRQLCDKADLIIKKIEVGYRQTKKTVEILNTLNKGKQLQNSRTGLNVSGDNRIKRTGSMNVGVTLQAIEKSILQCVEFAYQSFKEQGQQCYAVSKKNTESKKTQNNMSVSYVYKEIQILTKKPSKSQMWLWKDLREFNMPTEVKPKYQLQKIKENIESIRKLLDKQQSQYSTSCDLQVPSSGRAKFQIFANRIQIVNKKQQAIYFILPVSEIQSAQARKKKIYIKMNGGAEIKLSSFKQFTQASQKVNELMQKQGQADQGEAAGPARPKIQLTPEQVEAIQKRKQQIQKIRQKVEEYQKQGETVLKGVNLQDIYISIFADNSVNPLSKKVSFFQQNNQRMKNFNYKTENFDKPGPYYFTGENKDITFLNAPLFSIKKSQFDHPLPKIPMLPDKCHCSVESKLYWISDKEMDVKAEVRSSGTDLMETFFTVTLYRFKQVGDGVQMELYARVVFVKDTWLKGALTKGANDEFKKAVPIVVNDFERAMKAYVSMKNKGAGSAPVAQNQEEQKDQKIQVSAKEEKKPKFSVNMYLIAFVVFTIVFNLVFNLIF